MNAWIRWLAVSVCGVAAGCGGGGGGDRDGTPVTPMGMMPSPMPAPMPSPPLVVNPTVPQSVQDFQGIYARQIPDPQDPDTEIASSQAIITSDGKALLYFDAATEDGTVALVLEGRLTASGGDVTLTETTAYATDGTASAPASGVLRFDTNPSDDTDLIAELTINGEVLTFGFESLPDVYRTPSSLAAVRGTYRSENTDAEVTIDPAGNVIVSQDPDTGCGAMGQVSVDMPTVNAYALSLRLMNCTDATQNGVYTGRLALSDGLLGFIVHSDTMPLLDPDFEKVSP